jgi:hypothetical protein
VARHGGRPDDNAYVAREPIDAVLHEKNEMHANVRNARFGGGRGPTLHNRRRSEFNVRPPRCRRLREEGSLLAVALMQGGGRCMLSSHKAMPIGGVKRNYSSW